MMHFRVSFMGSDSSTTPQCGYVFLSERVLRKLRKCVRRLWESTICEESLKSQNCSVYNIFILYILDVSNRLILSC